MAGVIPLAKRRIWISLGAAIGGVATVILIPFVLMLFATASDPDAPGLAMIWFIAWPVAWTYLGIAVVVALLFLSKPSTEMQ